MNEELNRLLIDALKRTGGAIEKSIDFAIEQAPDLIQQAMLWHGVVSVFRCIVGLLILLGACFVHKYIRAYVKQNPSEDEAIVILLFSWPMLCLFALFVFSLEWLKILIAPKIWLIEYAMSLAK